MRTSGLNDIETIIEPVRETESQVWRLHSRKHPQATLGTAGGKKTHLKVATPGAGHVPLHHSRLLLENGPACPHRLFPAPSAPRTLCCDPSLLDVVALAPNLWELLQVSPEMRATATSGSPVTLGREKAQRGEVICLRSPSKFGFACQLACCPSPGSFHNKA